MNVSFAQLIHGYLDGTLTEAQEHQLNDLLKADPVNARRFAEMARLHDRLRHTLSGSEVRPILVPRRRFAVGFGLAAAGVLIAGLVWWAVPTRLTAASELERLIESSSRTGDRSYRIRSLDARPEQPEDRRPPIDGATLLVRDRGQYVLIRRFSDGRPFVTGSDGEQSWSIPPDGAVRVSNDPQRFRGPVPGQQHGIPFADLRSDLLELRDAYHVTFLGSQPDGRRRLVAEKKSAKFRGPRRVELEYDPKTDLIDRMVFRGMPRARGGPDSVAVELLNQDPLTPDFFQHEKHHALDRRVIQEE